jgi:VASP tetramerisation domain
MIIHIFVFFLSFQQVNGSDFSLPPAFDLKAFKAEILKEMRSEITKAKNEIIDGEYIY